MKHSMDMIVTDLDGTLLRTDKTISAGTQSVLRRCREKGIKIVYATGRGGSETRLIPAELFNGRIIMNGAMAYVNDKVVYSRLIPYQIARPLLIACNRYGMKTASECGGRHYSNFVVSDMWENITYFDVVDLSLQKRQTRM
jgi:hydroxymethylpyrimidine pyrophosphatase-like HAD family hydrolase